MLIWLVSFVVSVVGSDFLSTNSNSNDGFLLFGSPLVWLFGSSFGDDDDELYSIISVIDFDFWQEQYIFPGFALFFYVVAVVACCFVRLYVAAL